MQVHMYRVVWRWLSLRSLPCVSADAGNYQFVAEASNDPLCCFSSQMVHKPSAKMPGFDFILVNGG
jgi:hypothetical protein